MNGIRRIFGIVLILLAIAAFFAAPYRASIEISKAYETGKAISDNWIFWVIILMIFEPIMLAFARFGWFAFKGEYDSIADA